MDATDRAPPDATGPIPAQKENQRHPGRNTNRRGIGDTPVRNHAETRHQTRCLVITAGAKMTPAPRSRDGDGPHSDAFEERAVTGYCHNVQLNANRKAEDILEDFGNHTFGVLTEVGVTGREEVPPEMLEAMRSKGLAHHIVTNGHAEGRGHHSTMIIVHQDHGLVRNSKLFHRSGRALSVDVQLKGVGTRIRIIAVLQPSGLDGIKTETGAPTEAWNKKAAGQKRRLAEDIRKTVCRWRNRKGVDRVFLLGDLNETYDGAVDRLKVHTATGVCYRGTYRAGSTIANMIE